MEHQNETEKLTPKLNTPNTCAFDKVTVQYTEQTQCMDHLENKEVNIKSDT